MKVWGIDPSMSHTAIVICDYEDGIYKNWQYYQIDSKPDNKIRPKYLSDFNRSTLICTSVLGLLKDTKKDKPKYAFVEAPTGSQNATAMKGYAVSWMIIGLLRSSMLQCDFIPVGARDVKKWATGSSTAEKKEMILAASGYFPEFPWRKRKNGVVYDTEEHKADALMTLKFGLETLK